ncbi:MAG TPA: helix-hairpin-helix domain-containing protein, partial [Chitinophagaceae bacterium]|nr:helix-hairpin-helix domain-containing protein [Chitinophagaceae bacterium]
MKAGLCILILALAVCSKEVKAQEIPVTTQQQLENLNDLLESETEDDSYLQQLEYYRTHPININTATVEEFQIFRMLTQLQIQHLLQYRAALGTFVDIHELQSVPGWDVATIRRILPYFTVSNLDEPLVSRFTGGEHTIIARTSRILEKQKGYDTTLNTHYLGGKDHVLFRYKYQYKNILQYGVVADKDAGEQFFKGAGKNGFDFYSFHFFARRLGLIKAIAVGDFTINMGQGLIQWQSLAFKKSAEVLATERQAPLLRPYSSAGEFYFNRGVGVTIGDENLEATVFGSYRKVAASTGLDTLTNEEVFSSFLTTGLFRTPSEVSKKAKIVQSSFGGNVTYQNKFLKIGINGIGYQFTSPLQKRDAPYNTFAINGTQWWNSSANYSFTYKNVHFFGEAAIDKNISKAFVNG